MVSEQFRLMNLDERAITASGLCTRLDNMHSEQVEINLAVHPVRPPLPNWCRLTCCALLMLLAVEVLVTGQTSPLLNRCCMWFPIRFSCGRSIPRSAGLLIRHPAPTRSLNFPSTSEAIAGLASEAWGASTHSQ